MIEFENVSKYYKSKDALSNVSVKINKGEFVFIIGPSGAGKSTFIKLILKEINADEGIITVDENNVNKLSNRKIPKHRRNIGMVFQDFRLLPNKTVVNRAHKQLCPQEGPDASCGSTRQISGGRLDDSPPEFCGPGYLHVAYHQIRGIDRTILQKSGYGPPSPVVSPFSGATTRGIQRSLWHTRTAPEHHTIEVHRARPPQLRTSESDSPG